MRSLTLCSLSSSQRLNMTLFLYINLTNFGRYKRWNVSPKLPQLSMPSFRMCFSRPERRIRQWQWELHIIWVQKLMNNMNNMNKSSYIYSYSWVSKKYLFILMSNTKNIYLYSLFMNTFYSLSSLAGGATRPRRDGTRDDGVVCYDRCGMWPGPWV